MRYTKFKTYLMILPLVILMAVFLIGLLNGLAVSLGWFPPAGLTRFTLAYYREVLQDTKLTSSLLLSLYIALTTSVIAVVIGVAISMAATVSGLVRSRLFQVLKIPVIVPHTVCALLMLNLFAQSGLLARLAFHVGLIQGQEGFIPIMFESHAFGVILAYLWKEIPFVILVVITIMANINASLGEAALNLGASRWKVFRHITLPLCLPSITTSFIIIFAYSFGAYELPFLLGATEPKALPVQAYVEYTYPDLAHRPYAMVLNSVMVVFTVFISYLYYKLQNKLVRVGRER